MQMQSDSAPAGTAVPGGAVAAGQPLPAYASDSSDPAPGRDSMAPVVAGAVPQSKQTEAALHEALCVLFAQPNQYLGDREAETFCRLLCVNKELRDLFLKSEQKHIKARLQLVSYPDSDDNRPHNILNWLRHHLGLGSLHALQLESCHPDMSAAAAEVIAEAATATPRLLPASVSITSAGLVEDSVSRLPAGCLKCLKLADVAHELSDSTLSELQRLTALPELHLLWLNPAEGSLASALAALTSLTKLVIRHPHPPEQLALPASLVQLTVMQQLPPADACKDQTRVALAPLCISHLSSLTKLEIREVVPAQVQAAGEDSASEEQAVTLGVTEEYSLPANLEHLVVSCVTTATPLLSLPRLKRLDLTNVGMHTNWQELLRLTSMKSLQVVFPPVSTLSVQPSQLQGLAPSVAAFGLVCSSLVVEGSSWDGPGLAALASMTGITHLKLAGATQQGSAATTSQLASALQHLTGLRELQLAHMSLPLDDTQQQATEDEAWRPVMKALAELPSLRKLCCDGTSLGSAAVTALAAAPCLSDLAFDHCGVVETDLLGLIGPHFASRAVLERLSVKGLWNLSRACRQTVEGHLPALTALVNS